MIQNVNSVKILDTIGALYDSMTKTEKIIANMLLASPMLFSDSSLADIAKRLNVGEATFIRFCRTLGFKGFSDFKLALSIELATNNKPQSDLLDSHIQLEDSLETISKKLANSLQKVVAETMNLIDYNQLALVVEAIRNADRLFLFGMGSSGITAIDAKNKFMRIGIQVDASANNHFMYMQASLARPTDVVIGISHSGYSQEIIETLRIAKSNNATTVAITHNMRTPLTSVADYVLTNGNRQEALQGDSIGTKIAQLFVLDLIYAALVQGEEENTKKTKQKTLDVILQQRHK